MSWSITFILFLVGTVLIKNYHSYYTNRKREYSRAITYLETDVCADAFTRSELGDFQQCDKANNLISLNPQIHAFYDVVEDINPCGHNRCIRVWTWASSPVHASCIIGLVIFLIFQWDKWTFYKDIMRYSRHRHDHQIVAVN